MACCACDVPAALYSYSYEQNPRWTKLLPAQRELKYYLDSVADKYGVSQRMQFKVEVERFVWNDNSKRWTLFLKHLDSGVRTRHVCQVLFNCGGALVAPNPPVFKGRESFKGHVFHSTQ
jgi:cation diffusion facilitator CzcD-associated flavoprotein CzcO